MDKVDVIKRALKDKAESLVWSQIARPGEAPGERYKALEQGFVAFTLEVICPFVGLSSEEAALIRKTLAEESVFDDALFSSNEFLSHEAELYRKALTSAEASREPVSPVEPLIDCLDKKGLAIAITRAHGIKVIDENYPCTAIEDKIYVREEREDGVLIKWPVTGGAGGRSVEPVVDYGGYVLNALWLVGDLKKEGFAFEVKESMLTGGYVCIFSKGEEKYFGESWFLPEAIAKAYLKAFIFCVNEGAAERVIGGIKDAKV